MKRRVFAIFVAFAMIIGIMPSSLYADSVEKFSDIKGHWAEKEIQYFIDKGYVMGDGNGLIKPNDDISRAEFAALINKVNKFENADVNIDEYTDVSNKDWFYQDMKIAVAKEYLKGTSKTTLSPKDLLTREEAMVMLGRVKNIERSDDKAIEKFADYKDIATWAKKDVNAMISKEYVKGIDGKIMPKKVLSRAEAIVLLYRLFVTDENLVSIEDDKTPLGTVKKNEDTKTNTSKGSSKSGSSSSSGGSGGSGGSSNSGSGGTSGSGSTGNGGSTGNSGNTGNGGNTGTGGNTGNNTGDNTNDNTPTDEVKILVKEHTKLVSTGFSQYLAVEFEDGYSLDNVTLTLDGVNITDNMTKVTDDGKIVKWQLSSLKPAKLVAKNKDGKEQTIILSNNKNPEAPVLNDADEAAYAIKSHGTVSVWDYHLTNYDEDGNVKISPAKTTFSLEEKVNEHKFFSPVAELKQANNNYGVEADVQIKFNYGTDEQKTYFDAISDLALVAFNENQNTLNDSLGYEKETTTVYGFDVGILHIKAPQTNFFSNGRYLVRVPAKGYKTQLVPIHLVNELAPKMILDEQGVLESGKNIHLKVEDMTYGVTMPIETVTLTDPTGNTTTLEKIRDYYLIGDLFVLYNDVNAKNGRNNIPYKGKYTLNVQSNGFKDMEKSFMVEKGDNVPAGVSGRSIKIDAYSRATMIPGGGGTGGSGGNGGAGGSVVMSADLIFNVDLLTNAFILDELKIDNKDAKGIVDRFVSDTIADYVYAEEGTPFYTYRNWLDAYQDAKMAGNYLSFKDYIESGNAKTTQNKPYAVKEVLEDNTLGQTQYGGTYLGKDAPKFKLKDDATTVVEGNNAELVNDDEYYLSLATEIKVNGKKITLADYQVGDKELVILKDDLTLGKNEVEITATGYKQNKFTFDYEKQIEQDITLSSEGEHFVNEDVVINVENTDGDFLKNFKSVTVNGKTLLTESAGGSSQNDWYVLGTDSITIKGGNFKTAGTYEIAINAEFYELKTINVEVKEKAVDPNEPSEDAPYEVEKIKLLEGSFGDPDLYQVFFKAEGDDEELALENYLKAITSVTVNDEAYSKQNMSWRPKKCYGTAPKTSAYGGKNVTLKLTTDGFNKTGNTVVIKVEDYEDLTFTIDNNGNIVEDTDSNDNSDDNENDNSGNDNNNDDADESEELKKHPGKISIEVFNDYFKKCSRLSFEGASEAELADYLNNVETVTFDGEEKTYSDWGTTKPGYQISDNDAFGYPAYIDLQKAVLNSDKETEIKVIAKGYEDLSFTIDKDGNLVEDNNNDNTDDAEEPAEEAPFEIKRIETVDSWGGSDPGSYHVVFDAEESIIMEYLAKINSVTVNGDEYTKSTYSMKNSKYLFSTVKIGSYMGKKAALDLAINGFNQDENTVVIKADGYGDITFKVDNAGNLIK